MGPFLQAKRPFRIKSERETEREIEREGDRYAGQKKVALNKCSSFFQNQERERDRERDRERETDMQGRKKVALNKCSSFLPVNPKSKLREPSLHWSNALIKQPVDIDVYHDTKTKNRTQTKKKYFVEMDPVTAYGIALLPSSQ